LVVYPEITINDEREPVSVWRHARLLRRLLWPFYRGAPFVTLSINPDDCALGESTLDVGEHPSLRR
jgi:hypothetical protein